ncbi:hypothetical protein R3Q06_36070, partial [Rhodococcus erythropolis]|uniref:hypothetical protein n=1 Tax=Rhodococcus erythropolis TaxID=1833 RepID=UPI00294A9208
MTTVTAKTTKKNKKKYRRQHLRALAHAPLVVAVAATALCTGTGAGSAATGPAPDEVTASTSTPDTPLESGRPGWDWWSLYNDTGQPIYGTWSEQVGSDVSGLDLVAKWPLPNGGHESRPRNDSNFLP